MASLPHADIQAFNEMIRQRTDAYNHLAADMSTIMSEITNALHNTAASEDMRLRLNTLQEQVHDLSREITNQASRAANNR